MTTPADAEEPAVRPFAEFLVQQANGRTHSEISDALHALVAAVKETGKAGRLQLSIDVKPMSKSDDRALIITAAVAVKPPKGDAPTSVFFVDGEGNLSRTDPRQMSLPLREVEGRRTEQALKEAQQ